MQNIILRSASFPCMGPMGHSHLSLWNFLLCFFLGCVLWGSDILNFGLYMEVILVFFSICGYGLYFKGMYSMFSLFFPLHSILDFKVQCSFCTIVYFYQLFLYIRSNLIGCKFYNILLISKRLSYKKMFSFAKIKRMLIEKYIDDWVCWSFHVCEGNCEPHVHINPYW